MHLNFNLYIMIFLTMAKLKKDSPECLLVEVDIINKGSMLDSSSTTYPTGASIFDILFSLMLEKYIFCDGGPPHLSLVVCYNKKKHVRVKEAIQNAFSFFNPTRRMQIQPLNSLKTLSKVGDLSSTIAMTAHCFGVLSQVRAIGHCVIGQERDLL